MFSTLTATFAAAVVGTLFLTGTLAACTPQRPSMDLSAQERNALAALTLSSLGAPPPDPSNAVADDPTAGELGRAIFFDPRFSANGEVSCATCHRPERDFTDGLALAEGLGQTTRKTMSVVGAAHSTWQFWDGRKDSLWSQALAPLEAPDEHGLTRLEVAELVTRIYPEEYEAVFGTLPELTGLPERAGPQGDAAARSAWEAMSPADREVVTRTFVNVGKALAAFERGLEPTPTRFDRYAEAVLSGNPAARGILNAEELAGFKLFVGDAGCTTCHNGPLFTDGSFHNTGVPAVAGLPTDAGRAAGVERVRDDEFNCLGRYSDASPAACTALRGLGTDAFGLERAFKTPSLRNVLAHAPYMHAGQYATLREVLEHYSHAPAAPGGLSELRPQGFTKRQLEQLGAFLGTLGSEATQP